MDSITQSALGATIGHAFFRERLGPKAGVYGALLGLLPDLDLVVALQGEFASMRHHRGISHSLLVIPFYAALLGVVLWASHRSKGKLGSWIALALAAIWTHPLLDLCNQYGTPVWLPVDGKRYAFDAVAVLDPFVTFTLFLGLIAAGLSRLSLKQSVWTTRCTLALATLYLVAGGLVGMWAAGRARDELRSRGFEAVEVRACPMLFTIFARRVVARDEKGEIRSGYLSAIRPAPIHWHSSGLTDDPLVDAALADWRGELMQWFAMGMVSSTVNVEEDGIRVELVDARYGFITRPEASPFRMVFTFTDSGELTNVSRVHGPRDGVDVREELTALWRLLWNLPATNSG